MIGRVSRRMMTRLCNCTIPKMSQLLQETTDNFTDKVPLRDYWWWTFAATLSTWQCNTPAVNYSQDTMSRVLTSRHSWKALFHSKAEFYINSMLGESKSTACSNDTRTDGNPTNVNFTWNDWRTSPKEMPLHQHHNSTSGDSSEMYFCPESRWYR